MDSGSAPPDAVQGKLRVTSVRYVWLVCGLAILILDTIGSLAARHWGFTYGSLAPISYILYFCAGVAAGRLNGIGSGGLAGAVTGLVDATLGWSISRALGPGLGTASQITPVAVIVVALGVVFTGWILGLFGGVLGKVVHQSSADT